MALKKTKQTSFGIDVADAYHRVENLRLEGKDKIAFGVRSYANQEKPFFAEQVFSCDYLINGANPIAQAYNHLKTLEEFAGATDC
jgi:hypothetical protein